MTPFGVPSTPRPRRLPGEYRQAEELGHAASRMERRERMPSASYDLHTADYCQHELNLDQLNPTAATCAFTSGMNVPYDHHLEPGFHRAAAYEPARVDDRSPSAVPRGSADKRARFAEDRTARMPPLQGVDMRRPWMDQAFHRNGGVLDASGADLSGSVHPSLTPCSNEAVIKGRKPALYDGKGSWQDYRVQFEMLAAACGWGDRQKAIELATSLRDQAVGVLATLAPHQRYDYQSLVAALEARFEPRHQTEMHRAGLRTRLRKRNEPLMALAQDLKKLTRKAFPTANQELCEQLTLNYFIDALNDGEMEWNVYQGKPKSVEQAVSLAMEYESFKAARRGKKMDQLDLRAVRVDDLGRRPDARIQCKYCDSFAHSAKDCWKRVRDLEKTAAEVQTKSKNAKTPPKSGNGQ